MMLLLPVFVCVFLVKERGLSGFVFSSRVGLGIPLSPHRLDATELPLQTSRMARLNYMALS